MNVFNFLNTIPRHPAKIQDVTVITPRRHGKTYGMILFLKQEFEKGILEIGVVFPSKRQAYAVLKEFRVPLYHLRDKTSFRLKNIRFAWGDTADFRDCDFIFLDEFSALGRREYIIPNYKPFTLVALTTDTSFLPPDYSADFAYDPDRIYVKKSYL